MLTDYTGLFIIFTDKTQFSLWHVPTVAFFLEIKLVVKRTVTPSDIGDVFMQISDTPFFFQLM